MNGKVYVITGANGGIGFQTVKNLLITQKNRIQHEVHGRTNLETNHNHHVQQSVNPREDTDNVSMSIVLACRKLDSAYETIKLLSDDVPDDGSVSMHPMELNLGDTISIQTFASDITSQFPKVDCLICNAGVLIPNVPNDITTGYESELGDAENAETAIWYHENDEPSNQNQVFRRQDASPVLDVGEMSYSDIILTNEQKNKREQPEKDKLNYITTDGHEINVGINHLGHFLLVNLLIDRLQRSRSSRVIIVSSILLKNATLKLSLLKNRGKMKLLKAARDQTLSRSSTANDTPHRNTRRNGNPNCDPKENYNESKLMNALFARVLDLKLKDNGVKNISVYCVSPGWCKTNLHRNTIMPWYTYIFALPVAALFMKSAKEGCRTIVHCATEDNAKLTSGKFYRNGVIDENIENFLDTKFTRNDCEDLFYRSQEAVGLHHLTFASMISSN